MSVESFDINQDNTINQKDIVSLGETLGKMESPAGMQEFISMLEKGEKFQEALSMLKQSFLDLINSKDFSLKNRENIIIIQFYAKFYLGINISIDGVLSQDIETIFTEIKSDNNVDIGLETLSLSEIQEIDQYAQSQLSEFVGNKAKLLKGSKEMLLGPTMDLSMALVIGKLRNSEKFSKKQNLAYWTENEWGDYRKYLKEQGVPSMSPKEMRKINRVGYLGRLEGNPDGKWVAKHFPGGDEKLLQTHIGPVKFGSGNEYVKESLSLFEEIIKSGKAPKGIMMAHASYDTSYFPGIEEIINRDKEKYPYLKNIPFDEIPASLNPYLNSYLREKLGYSGNIIPDWFGGMKAYTSFVDKTENKFISDPLAKLAYLSVMAGNTFITGVKLSLAVGLLNNSKVWLDFQKNDPEGFKIFAERATKAVQPFLDKMEDKKWGMKIENLIFLMMCEPEKNLGIKEKQDGTINLDYNGKGNSVGELMRKIGGNGDGEKITQSIVESGLSQNDVWTRTGVQSLVYRQAFISELYFKDTGKKLELPKYPEKISEEDNWFDGLMKNKEFKRYYDKIDWDKVAEIDS